MAWKNFCSGYMTRTVTWSQVKLTYSNEKVAYVVLGLHDFHLTVFWFGDLVVSFLERKELFLNKKFKDRSYPDDIYNFAFIYLMFGKQSSWNYFKILNVHTDFHHIKDNHVYIKSINTNVKCFELKEKNTSTIWYVL